jgi:hypothetical protein
LWEQKLVLADLTSPDLPQADSFSTLADLPLPVFYRLFTNPDVFNSESVRIAILNLLPSKPHPTQSPPPPVCLIHALVDENNHIRSWALEQLHSYPNQSLRTDDFTGPYYNALRLLLQAIDGITPPDTHFTLDTTLLWIGLAELIPHLPLDASNHRQLALEVRDRICGHLNDSGPRSSWFCFIL